jgi:hypothetical protein
VRDEIQEGYFKYDVGKHVIFYRHAGKSQIEIVSILHAAWISTAFVIQYQNLTPTAILCRQHVSSGPGSNRKAINLRHHKLKLRDVSRARLGARNLEDSERQDYIDALDKLEALRLVKPFHGDNTALSGMSNAEANAVPGSFNQNRCERHQEGAVEDLGSGRCHPTSKTRQIYMKRKYEHYVPLHRDEVGGSTIPRIEQGFNIRTGIKSAFL